MEQKLCNYGKHVIKTCFSKILIKITIQKQTNISSLYTGISGMNICFFLIYFLFENSFPLSFYFLHLYTSASTIYQYYLPVRSTSTIYQYYLPVLPTSTICQYYLPVFSTSTIYLYYLPVLSTSTIYQYYLPVLSTSTIYQYSLPVLSTSTIYQYYLPVFSPCTIYQYYIPVLSTSTIDCDIQLINKQLQLFLLEYGSGVLNSKIDFFNI